MQIILFTKIFTGGSVEDIGRAAQKLGFDGLDLAVRAGQCIEPSHARHALPQAVETWKEFDLAVPMITLDGHHIDPSTSEIESIFEACRDAEIPFIKLGYWQWRAQQEYWDGVSEIRRALEGFQKLGEKYGVCSLLHTHAGPHYGSNASGVMHLLHGFDPQHVAAYLDPAHQVIQGEPAALAFSIAAPYLRMIGVKNARYFRPQTSDDESASKENAAWQSEWCLLEDGLVDWPAVLAALRQAEYCGPLSFHATYSQARDQAGALRCAAQDMKRLRVWLDDSSKEWEDEIVTIRLHRMRTNGRPAHA